MLTLQIPMLLALLGTALMAVVIFAPTRIPIRAAAPIAPRVEAQPVWAREHVAPEPAIEVVLWPTLIDRRALECDVTARLRIVDALGAVHSRWADEILQHAAVDDPDESVRDAASAAHGANLAGGARVESHDLA